MKKIFFTIIIALAFLLFSQEVYAVTYTDVSDSELTSILDILASYNIINGYSDNTFRSGNCVTRAEAAKIVVSLLGYEDFSLGITSDFSDMNNHWAGRYAEITNALDLITVFDDNTFRPNDNISFEEAVQIIVKLLGYNNTVEDIDYMSIAKKLNLLKNTDNFSNLVTRKSMANLIYNALDCNTVNIAGGKVIINNNKLFNNLGSKDVVEITDKYALEHSEYNLSSYLLNTYDVYYDLNKNIVLINNPLYKTISGYIKSSLPTYDIFMSDKYNIKQYNIKNAKIVFNGMNGSINNRDIKNSDAKLVMNDNSEIIGVVLNKATDMKIVGPKDTYIKDSTTFLGKNLPVIDGKTDYDHIIVTGAADSLYNIKTDDVVYFYETKEPNGKTSMIKLEVVRNTISGVYNSSYTEMYEQYYKVNNNAYKLDYSCKIDETPQAGDIIKLILDKDNNVIEIRIEKYIKKPESYGYILNVNQGTSDLPSVTILDINGKTIKYNLKENSGAVTVLCNNNSIIYSTSLSKNDFIKYDLLNNNTIKIAEKVNGVFISGNYNSSYSTVNNSYSISNSSCLLLNNSYARISSKDIGTYIEGKAIVEKNTIKLMLITKNIVTVEDDIIINSSLPEIKPVVPPEEITYTGILYGAIKGYDSKTNQISMLNYSYTFNADNNISTYINNYKNLFVKVKVVNNIVTEISSIKPEITISRVTAIYKERLEIDKKSFVEYSSDVKVYICSKNDSGVYTSFTNGTISDVTINSKVEFYITSNRYDGVIDVIIIYK